MKGEMENKHHEKKKLKKEIVAISNQLQGVFCIFLYNALVHKLRWQSKVVSNQYYFNTRRNC